MKTLFMILALALSAAAQGSLYFAPGVPSNVKHPKLWTVGVDYGPFFLETIWRPTEPNHLGYGISDGAGGAHAILLGYESSATQWGVTGNIYTGTGVLSFASPPVARLNEWAHVAVGYDGQLIRIWVNGIIVSETPYTGVRRTVPGGSDGHLYVGGSFHLNFGGNIARVRLIEGQCPFHNDFSPQLYFTKRIILDHTESFVLANFVADYSSPSELFLDSGIGTDGETRDGTFSMLTPDTPTPIFTEDRPKGTTSNTYVPPPVPDGALIFDSFTRPNATQLFGDLQMGNTEGGSLGVLQWPGGFGIMGEAAFGRYNAVNFAALETGRQDVTVRVDRPWNTNTGLTLRYSDQFNCIRISNVGNKVYVHSIVNNVITGPVFDVPGFTTLSATSIGQTLTVWVDGLKLGDFTIPPSLTGTKHGLAYVGPRSFYDNFTVYAAQ